MNGLTCRQIWGDTVRKNLSRLDLKSPYFCQIAVAICCLSTTGGIRLIRSAIAKTAIILLICKIYAPVVLILSHRGLVYVGNLVHSKPRCWLSADKLFCSKAPNAHFEGLTLLLFHEVLWKKTWLESGAEKLCTIHSLPGWRLTFSGRSWHRKTLRKKKNQSVRSHHHLPSEMWEPGDAYGPCLVGRKMAARPRLGPGPQPGSWSQCQPGQGCGVAANHHLLASLGGK